MFSSSLTAAFLQESASRCDGWSEIEMDREGIELIFRERDFAFCCKRTIAWLDKIWRTSVHLDRVTDWLRITTGGAQVTETVRGQQRRHDEDMEEIWRSFGGEWRSFGGELEQTWSRAEDTEVDIEGWTFGCELEDHISNIWTGNQPIHCRQQGRDQQERIGHNKNRQQSH